MNELISENGDRTREEEEIVPKRGRRRCAQMEESGEAQGWQAGREANVSHSVYYHFVHLEIT